MLQLQKNNDIQFAGFELTKNGLTPVGTPTFKQWEKVGQFIKRSHEAVQFWRGDWLNYGEHTYDQWTQYFGEEEASYQTLANEKWVASRIPPSRRRETLSWSHHAEVADLGEEDQEQMLSMAEEHKMNRSDFRKAVRHFKLKLDIPELPDTMLEKTSDEVFEKVQACVNASVATIELLETIEWNDVHKDARDYLLSHLKRAGTFYFSLVTSYAGQKPLSK